MNILVLILDKMKLETDIQPTESTELLFLIVVLKLLNTTPMMNILEISWKLYMKDIPVLLQFINLLTNQLQSIRQLPFISQLQCTMVKCYSCFIQYLTFIIYL